MNGDYRRGYEIILTTGEAVGVTNKYERGFIVYYHQERRR